MSSTPKTNQAPPAPFKFTPEFFYEYSHPEGCSPEEMADVCNEYVAKKWAEETAKWMKVFGNEKMNDINKMSLNIQLGATHFAYLTPPQLIEVEECGHKPALVCRNGRWVEEYQCEKCGVELEAIWTPVKKDGANG